MTGLPRQTTYSLFFDLFVLLQRVHELLATAMASSPLTPEEYATYSVVFEDEAVSPTALAAQLSKPLTTVVDDIREMEARGHARRMPNPRDGRSHLIVLTGEGLRAHVEASRRFEIAYRTFVEALPHGEATARAEVEKLLSAAECALRITAPIEGSLSR